MDAELSTLLTDVCSDIVPVVEADYLHRKDFGYSWNVRKDRAIVNLPDYLSDAPEDVISDFGRMVVLRGSHRPWSYPASLDSYVRSDGYIVSKRPVFIQRSRNLTRSDSGEHRFIPDCVDRLLEAGLLLPGDISNSWFSWTRRDSARRLGFCSRMFRVVGISSILDDPDVPLEVLDYVVYHECLHLRQGYRSDGRAHDRQFRQWEHAYPDWEGCETILRRLGVHD